MVRFRDTLATVLTVAIATPVVLWVRGETIGVERFVRQDPVEEGGSSPDGCSESFPTSEVSADATPDENWTLAELTSWRRLRGEPDPAEIEVVPVPSRVERLSPEVPGPEMRVPSYDPVEHRIELPFPELPILEVVLRNVDIDGHPFLTRCGYWGPSAYSFRVQPLERDDDWGVHSRFGFFRGNSGTPTLVESGAVLAREGSSARISLERLGLAHAARPGPMAFRLEYGLAEYFMTHAPHDGCTPLAISRELVFEWLPVNVGRNPDIDAEVARTIDTLCAREEVAVGRKGALAPIARLGLYAVPALLVALEESSSDPHRRAVILAALHAATGLFDPRERAYRTGPGPGPVGKYEQVGPSRTWKGDDGGPSHAAQEPLVRRWLAVQTSGLVQ